MIVEDTRTPCVDVGAIQRRLNQGARGGQTQTQTIQDAIDDITAEAESFLGIRLDESQVVEMLAPKARLKLTVTPVIDVESVTVNGSDVPFTRHGRKVLLAELPTTPVTVTYVAGLPAGSTQARAAGNVIKRAAIRAFTNPTGVVQSGGPGQTFSPDAGGVQAILTRSEKASLRALRPRWFIA